MIWDLHCHLSGESTAARRMSGWRSSSSLPIAWESNGWSCSWGRFSSRSDSDQIRRQNDEVLQALSLWHHRAFGFDVSQSKYEEESLKNSTAASKMARWSASNVGGGSLHRSAAGFDRRAAAELKAVIYQHTWLKTREILVGESTPDEFAEFAANIPTPH